ncbi:unnamed protein product [Adineta steineri]|uniref:NAD(P)(+)--arginine ADP-ribosyltransferase n=1 Tax=Adineta steineri TaxID=433720 RepID=A0A815RF37_9BILA|nr:unnamed protein product [Adineta steineri]CAF1637268.1 unnamed protein product [Adineta steineri]
MSQKKVSTVNSFSNGGKSRQAIAPTKGKTVTKQKLLSGSSSPSSNPTTTSTDVVEDASDLQNYTLFWLDSNITPDNADCLNTITQLQSIGYTVRVFDDANECINILNKIKKQKVLLVVSDELGQNILPRIHDMHQLTTVFVFCNSESNDQSWTKDWIKIQDTYTNINDLCESIKQIIRQYDEDSIDISLISTNDTSDGQKNQLDQSFMYTQLMKEILLELPHDDESIKEFVTYYSKQYSRDKDELKNVKKFQSEYTGESPIWWYTYECFLYHELNRGLREQQVDVIIRMGFFISDLLQFIEKLHNEQAKDFQNEFTVYRGQRILPEKFEKMKKAIGGLISFNSFLSTSLNQDAAMKFANSALEDSSHVAIMFIITINPTISSIPYARIEKFSCYHTEEEILFSMPTIFHISDIKPSDINNRLWNVYLTSTGKSDEQIINLMKHMREEIQGSSPLYQLGALMIKLGEFDKAEEVYINLLKHTIDELEKGNIYYQLGQIKDSQELHDKALDYYQRALTIYEDKLSPNHSNIATCYNNIGLAYDNMGDYQKALPFYEKALDIYQKTLDANHRNIAAPSSSIGLIYNTMGEYQKALSYCTTAHENFQTSLPSNHPLLATSYSNIGTVYQNLKNYPEAISSYKRALEIGQSALPPTHPDLAVYRHNLESISKNESK